MLFCLAACVCGELTFILQKKKTRQGKERETTLPDHTMWHREGRATPNGSRTNRTLGVVRCPLPCCVVPCRVVVHCVWCRTALGWRTGLLLFSAALRRVFLCCLLYLVLPCVVVSCAIFFGTVRYRGAAGYLMQRCAVLCAVCVVLCCSVLPPPPSRFVLCSFLVSCRAVPCSILHCLWCCALFCCCDEAQHS